jgi:uncharacterized protein (TIGR00369 family)
VSTVDASWLDRVRRAESEPWSSELGRCLACTDRPAGCRFGITAEWVDSETLMAEIVLGAEHEGGPGVAHGGVISGILDEALGHAVMSRGVLVVTGSLTVDFVKPVPLGRSLRAAAAVVGSEGRRWMVEGEITLASSGEVLARGAGVWVAIPAGHYERHRGWLSDRSGETRPGVTG